MSLDGAVERAGRWLAGRQSRRSFLGRFGKAAVLVASGPAVAGLLAERAGARLCGQTGVSPKCATFDCLFSDSVWGWCWYASDGCCRNGGLKKICDCCTTNWPNVHGYCPSGTNVRCVVESCGTDPRVQTTMLTRLVPDGSGYAAAARSMRFRTAPTVVVTDAVDGLVAAVAAPVAGVIGAPLLRFPRDGFGSQQAQLLSELGARRVVLVAPALGGQADALRGAGLEVEVVGAAGDLGELSVEVARWIRGVNRIGRTVTVVPQGLSLATAGAAAVFSACQGFPLLVGGDAAQAVGLPTLLVGPEAVALASSVGVSSEATTARSYTALTLELAELAYNNPITDRGRTVLVPDGSDLLGLVDLGAPVVVHPTWSLGPVHDWLFRHQRAYGSFGEAYLGLGSGRLGDAEVYRLQSALNGYEAQHLQGVGGQGLPVFSQPLAERELGRARVTGRPTYPDQTPPAYWTSRAQTLR
jgi:hypothetical protein